MAFAEPASGICRRSLARIAARPIAAREVHPKHGLVNPSKIWFDSQQPLKLPSPARVTQKLDQIGGDIRDGSSPIELGNKSMGQKQNSISVGPNQAAIRVPAHLTEDPLSTKTLTLRRLQTLAFEITMAESRERQRIANGLHDELGQLLAMLQIKLSELSHLMALGPAAEPLVDTLDELRELVGDAAKATRAVIFELHSPVLLQLGLDAAIRGLALRLQRQVSLKVEVEGQLAKRDLGAEFESVLFRTVRELAVNAIKHAAQATCLIFKLDDGDGDELCIRVVDDGAGFDTHLIPGQFSAGAGFGLLSADAQMQAIGGRLVISSKPGRGTMASVKLPLQGLAPAPQSWVSPTGIVEAS
jgi:signal transduction histidine kinase